MTPSSEELTLAVPADTDGDYVVQNHDFGQRLKHWGGFEVSIPPAMFNSAQLATVVQCGVRMEESKKTLKTDDKEDYLLETYTTIVENEIAHLLDDEGIAFFKVLKGAKGGKPVDGKQLLSKFNNAKSIIKNQIMPLFPKDFHLMGSGTGLRMAYREALLKLYRKRLVEMGKMTKEEAEEVTSIEKEFDFLYKSQYPMTLMLAAKIHRADKLFITNVGDATKKGTKRPMSRAASQRERQAQYDKEHSKRVKESTKEEAWKKRIEFANASARSQQAQSTEYMANTVARAGKVDEISKGLELIAKYGDQSDLSELDKKKMIGKYLRELPEPNTYASDTKPRQITIDLSLSDTDESVDESSGTSDSGGNGNNGNETNANNENPPAETVGSPDSIGGSSSSDSHSSDREHETLVDDDDAVANPLASDEN